MARMKFSEAIDRAVAEAMAADERVVVIGEDVPMLHPALLARFGRCLEEIGVPDRRRARGGMPDVRRP